MVIAINKYSNASLTRRSSGKVQRRFIEWSSISDVIINEVFLYIARAPHPSSHHLHNISLVQVP